MPGSPAEDGAGAARRAEISAGLRAVRQRIAAACAEAGRSPAEITLIAVTKTRPASDVLLLGELGLTDVGENRDQEACAKAAACAAAGLKPTWHFIGQLQVNKAASVVSYADVVHSVDRLRLANALGRHARAAGRTITCLVQVSLDDPDGADGPDHGRGGVAPGQVLDLATAIAGQQGLELGGVMAVAPLAQPAAAFAQLAEVSRELRSRYRNASVISAGMSGDLEEAIMSGATHVRIGTALLGGRPAFVR
ncbi:MAG: YggS family pyridoxal phosphate-dependent enzyme [Actinomycetota bacterium]